MKKLLGYKIAYLLSYPYGDMQWGGKLLSAGRQAEFMAG